MSDRIWTTKRGEKIRVADMEDRHLLYSLRMIQNQITDCREAEQIYFSPFACTAEIASEHEDQFMCEMWEKKPILYNWENILMSEVTRRGLTPLPHREVRALPKIKSVQHYKGAVIMELEE